MDPKVLNEWENHYDAKFAKEHSEFARWWRTHPHCDSDPKWSVKPRVAWKCEIYQQEFMEAKSVGIA